MSFENPDLSEITEKKQEAALSPEAPQKDIELTPAMQELYQEITAETIDENQLENEAKKMSAAERLGVLGKAIERAGKLARRIAVVAFAAFSPSLAGSADTVKQVEKDLMSETQKEWGMQKEKSQSNEIKLSPELAARAKEIIEDTDVGFGLSPLETVLNGFTYRGSTIYEGFILDKNITKDQIVKIYNEVVKEKENEQDAQKTELAKSAPKSAKGEMSEREKEDREIMAIINNNSSELTGSRFIPLSLDENSEIRKAYRAGLFKNNKEYKEWHQKINLEKAKRLMGKYPGVVEELKNNLDKIKNPGDDHGAAFEEYLIEKYNINEDHNPSPLDNVNNPREVVNLLIMGVLNSF
jgi:hypothetical protein